MFLLSYDSIFFYFHNNLFYFSLMDFSDRNLLGDNKKKISSQSFNKLLSRKVSKSSNYVKAGFNFFFGVDI